MQKKREGESPELVGLCSALSREDHIYSNSKKI